MDARSRRTKERESTVSALNAAIEAMNLAKGTSTIAPAKGIFGSVSITLTLLRVGSCWFVLIECRLKCT